MVAKSVRPVTIIDPNLGEIPDPPKKKKADMLHLDHLRYALGRLEEHFRNRPDVMVGGEGYLVIEVPRGRWERHFRPDCIVAFGVDAAGIKRRNGYVISEAGKPPDFVLEIASRSTGKRDETTKRVGYAEYGVTEYWRFDRTGGKYHFQALSGDWLVDGEYEPIEVSEDSDGVIRGHSEVLGLDVCWVDGDLHFYDTVADRYLRSHSESESDRRAAESRADAAESRAEREGANRRAVEAENAALREQLRRLQQ